MNTLTIQIQGMSCAGCATSIEQAVLAIPGVTNCQVNFALATAAVSYDPSQLNLTHIQAAIAAIGYTASPMPDADTANRQKITEATAQRNLEFQVLVSSVLSTLLMLGSLPMMTGLALPWIPVWLMHPWVQLVLTTPVLFWAGRSFYVRGWRSLCRRQATMDTLIAMGTGVAYTYSVFVTVFPSFSTNQGWMPEVYYEVAAIIVTLILLGRLLENRARGETSTAIHKLMGLQAKNATIIRDGQELLVPIEGSCESQQTTPQR